MGKLDGKVAVITGATSGMALAGAKLFVDEGAHVFISGRRQDALEETAQLQWIAAQVGPVQKISTGEVRSVLTGARKEEFYSHVWGHYARLDPWFSAPEQEHSNRGQVKAPAQR